MKKDRRQGPAGMLLVDKPAGMTSHDVVAWVRRGLGTRRVGHGGTLDPLATGLLPVLVGTATRLVDTLHEWPKTYVGVVLLGRETETGDLEGEDPGHGSFAPLPPRVVLHEAVQRLTGPQLQVPPVYSAKKIGGEPAHRLARHGVPPVLPAVPVTVHRFRVEPRPGGGLAFAARVSSGTYIRSLARDLGRILGTGACLAHLRRTAIGPLRVRDAVRPGITDPAALPGLLRRPEAIPLPVPTVVLDAEAAALFCGGRTSAVPGPATAGRVRVLGPVGLLGLGELEADGRLQPRAVLTVPPDPVAAGEHS